MAGLTVWSVGNDAVEFQTLSSVYLYSFSKNRHSVILSIIIGITSIFYVCLGPRDLLEPESNAFNTMSELPQLQFVVSIQLLQWFFPLIFILNHRQEKNILTHFLPRNFCKISSKNNTMYRGFDTNLLCYESWAILSLKNRLIS